MLVRLIFLAQSLILTNFCYSQVIHSLRTDQQALTFVKGLRAKYNDLTLRPSKPTIELQKTEKRSKLFGSICFEKADFDQNGQMDLLFNGFDRYDKRTSLVVLSFGKDSFQIRELTPWHLIGLFASKVIKINNQDCIKTLMDVYRYNEKSLATTIHQRIDTLVWRFNDSYRTIRSLPMHYREN